MIIFDEVDGVVNNEQNSAISYLLKYFFDKTKGKQKFPLIFICNNLYIKGLKELREQSEIFNFKRDFDSV